MDTALYKHSFKAPDRPLTSLSVFNTGVQRCESAYTWGPGVRDHYLIHYVIGGRGTYTLRGRTFDVREGDMFLAWPEETIIYRADAGDPWTYCWVGFGGLEARTLISQTDFRKEAPILHAKAGEVAYRLLMDIYESHGVHSFEMARMTGKLYAFIAWLMEEAKIEPRRRRQAGIDHVERACEYIANNYASPISVQDIAKGVGVCRSLLNRAFQQHMETSPVQYLTRYRMHQATILLKRTDLSVKAVALSVGYEDPLYFSRRFREIRGCAPREYAERVEQEIQA